jgi:hypothetical protein
VQDPGFILLWLAASYVCFDGDKFHLLQAAIAHFAVNDVMHKIPN